MAYLHVGRAHDAVSVLDRAHAALAGTTSTSDKVDIETFRGLALHLACRNSESHRALQWAALRQDSNNSGKLAQSLLIQPPA